MTPLPIKVCGIVLAAGTASRMGKTKQLLPFNDTTILGQVISQAINSDLDQVNLVLGHKAEKIRRDLDKRCDLSGINFIINTHYKDGQSTSLVAGIENLSQDIDAAMFLLGDQPLVTKAIINHLINAFKSSNAPIVIPYYKSLRGNPVTISKTLFSQLKTLTADAGARVIFKKYKHRILKININNPAVAIDVDTPQDYKKLISLPHQLPGNSR